MKKRCIKTRHYCFVCFGVDFGAKSPVHPRSFTESIPWSQGVSDSQHQGHSWEIAECSWEGAVGTALTLIVAGGMDLRACRPQHHQGIFDREFLITQECDKVCFTWLSKSLHILRDGTLDMLHAGRVPGDLQSKNWQVPLSSHCLGWKMRCWEKILKEEESMHPPSNPLQIIFFSSFNCEGLSHV